MLEGVAKHGNNGFVSSWIPSNWFCKYLLLGATWVYEEDRRGTRSSSQTTTYENDNKESIWTLNNYSN